MKKSKKITALSLSFAFVLNTFATAIPVSAETAGESQVYAYEGYTVEYKIVNEWTGNQNIQVTITNTSDELISNWAVGYNASGEINGLWNAQIYGQQGTEYILSCASYNSEIVPGDSVNFGYTLTGDSFKFPQNIINCAERVDITDGYNVYYNITGDYGDTYQAEMFIENLSDTDISAWQLSFDGNVTIDNLWNGKLIENTDGSFKVKNAEHNSVISTNNSASFNFGGTRITEDDTTIGESSDDSGMTVEADSNYDIIFDNYKLTGVVIPMEFEFEFDPELDSDEDGLPDYLERRIGSDRHNADTDGDSLPDGYEYYTLGTGLKKTDSDDNGLSDADEDFDEEGLTNLEEYNLGTSPFNPDSDYDGLSDYDEINTYNTDPLNHDSDTDKVTDGDEVILGLDPNNPETNGYPDSEYTTEQTVSADSEALEYINNIEDNPYTVSVEITAAGVTDNCLSADESGYSSAILQNDAVLGVVPELTYSDGLSVTDVVINFTLDDSVVENTLGVYADNPAFDGINRFNVFKFFEDTNTLLPIETSYNESTNTVSTHVDETGTYCLIDMEIWLNNIENMPAGNYYTESDNEPANIVFCLDTRSIIDSESFDAIKADIKAITEDAFSRYGEIKVYVYYQRFGSNFKVTNNLLKDSVTGENYFTGYEEAAKALDRLETYMIKSNFWAYDYVEATQYIIDNCDENIIAMYHITDDDRVMGSVSGAKKLLQTVQNSKYTNKDDEEINRIYVSLLCPNSDKVIDSNSYVYELVEKSGGVIYTDATIDEELETETVEVPVFFTASTAASAESSTINDEAVIEEDTFADTVRDCIIGILGEGNSNEYKIISSTGLTTIKLDKPLTKDSDTDTDNDDLSDWKEVNTDLIIKLLVGDTVGDITLVNRKWSIPNYWLPTFEELKNNYSDLYYVEGGLAKWYDANDNGGNPLLNMKDVRVLPIDSDPVDADGDNDGITDGSILVGDAKYTDDDKPLKFSYKYYDDQLQKLSKEIPNAQFNFVEYDFTLDEFVESQYESGWNLTHEKNYKASNAEQQRLYKKNGISYPNMFFPTREGIKFYCDTSTYMDSKHIYAFYDIRNNYATQYAAVKMLQGSYFDQGDKINEYAKYFVEAANESGLDLSFIISKCFIECGSGKDGDKDACSELCAGMVATSGKSYNQTVYNMYGIGAYDSERGATAEGCIRASNEGWITERDAIVDGAKYICDSFLENNQYTQYLQKYNLVTFSKDGEIGLQYATAINYAYVGAEQTYSNLKSISNCNTLCFEIPVFNDYYDVE